MAVAQLVIVNADSSGSLRSNAEPDWTRSQDTLFNCQECLRWPRASSRADSPFSRISLDAQHSLGSLRLHDGAVAGAIIINGDAMRVIPLLRRGDGSVDLTSCHV